jgi:hypothetical protein
MTPGASVILNAWYFSDNGTLIVISKSPPMLIRDDFNDAKNEVCSNRSV